MLKTYEEFILKFQDEDVLEEALFKDKRIISIDDIKTYSDLQDQELKNNFTIVANNILKQMGCSLNVVGRTFHRELYDAFKFRFPGGFTIGIQQHQFLPLNASFNKTLGIFDIPHNNYKVVKDDVEGPEWKTYTTDEFKKTWSWLSMYFTKEFIYKLSKEVCLK